MVLPREVLLNTVFALAVSCFFLAPGPGYEMRQGLLASKTVTSVDRVWTQAASIVSFSLSFFLSQVRAISHL